MSILKLDQKMRNVLQSEYYRYKRLQEHEYYNKNGLVNALQNKYYKRDTYTFSDDYYDKMEIIDYSEIKTFNTKKYYNCFIIFKYKEKMYKTEIRIYKHCGEWNLEIKNDAFEVKKIKKIIEIEDWIKA